MARSAGLPLLGPTPRSSLSVRPLPCPITRSIIVGVGTDIWAYGIAGEGQGSYSATLDNITIGQYTANARATDYHKLLFAAHGLRDGPLHYLTLSNIDDGSSLAFDVAIINSAAAFNRYVLLKNFRRSRAQSYKACCFRLFLSQYLLQACGKHEHPGRSPAPTDSILRRPARLSRRAIPLPLERGNRLRRHYLLPDHRDLQHLRAPLHLAHMDQQAAQGGRGDRSELPD